MVSLPPSSTSIPFHISEHPYKCAPIINRSALFSTVMATLGEIINSPLRNKDEPDCTVKLLGRSFGPTKAGEPVTLVPVKLLKPGELQQLVGTITDSVVVVAQMLCV
jgi:hypothetical protein